MKRCKKEHVWTKQLSFVEDGDADDDTTEKDEVPKVPIEKTKYAVQQAEKTRRRCRKRKRISMDGHRCRNVVGASTDTTSQTQSNWQ